MRGSIALLAASVLAVYDVPASAIVRISSDRGGQIGPYLEKLQSLRSSGESVIIDGPCLSACTMVLGMIPRDRICVTSRARLGFHSAWHPDRAGRQVSDQSGTNLLMSMYPQQVRDWVNRRGGLSPHLIYLSGESSLPCIQVATAAMRPPTGTPGGSTIMAAPAWNTRRMSRPRALQECGSAH